MFLGYTIEIFALTMNRAPSKPVETAPYDISNGIKPNLSFLKIWGCNTFVEHLQPIKLHPKCYFLGYPKEVMFSSSIFLVDGYRLIHGSSSTI